jgi:hypothetical protein
MEELKGWIFYCGDRGQQEITRKEAPTKGRKERPFYIQEKAKFLL